MTQAVAYWLDTEIAAAPPDYVETNKRHGRVEERSYWWTANAELTAYLAQDYGWPGIQQCGRVRRRRRPLHATTWTEEEEHVVVYGSQQTAQPTPLQCSQWLRQHWEVENRIFWVLDMTYGEDRNHARVIALPLSKLRCLALNVIRQRGYRYVPDAHRAAAACNDRGLSWLGQV